MHNATAQTMNVTAVARSSRPRRRAFNAEIFSLTKIMQRALRAGAREAR
jgi:hypothetical protein